MEKETKFSIALHIVAMIILAAFMWALADYKAALISLLVYVACAAIREMGKQEGQREMDEKQWADEHPKKSWWRPVTEWPKDGEPILMKLDNGKYQYSEWEKDGKGFNEGFAEINFGSGAMMRLPITYKVVAWRPLADVINELSDHGVITTSESKED